MDRLSQKNSRKYKVVRWLTESLQPEPEIEYSAARLHSLLRIVGITTLSFLLRVWDVFFCMSDVCVMCFFATCTFLCASRAFFARVKCTFLCVACFSACVTCTFLSHAQKSARRTEKCTLHYSRRKARHSHTEKHVTHAEKHHVKRTEKHVTHTRKKLRLWYRQYRN